MPVFWKRKTPTWSQYHENFEFLSDPSRDLIETFKKEIVEYDDPRTHKDYVKCDNVERSKGHLLFILGSRVEILLKPVREDRVLYFVHCEDI